ncbi:hypothetical protein B0H13DRAFT_2267580 [Mycena leptocephala]|nr:hypothetical protein B0H13DRAFT_2267580 [Mycena leptocephala]
MDSPFDDILHTNVVPSDSECKRIRDFLEGPQKEIADLTRELKRLDSLRKEISHKRRQLKEFINDHLALVSPNPAISSQEAPLLLCQICQSWRSIALATPRLWAAIHIVVPDQSRLQQLADRVSIWFERTCNPNHHISPLYSTLAALSQRWKSLEIPLPEEGSPLLSVTSENAPLLETVKIDERRGDRSLAPPDCTSLLFLGTLGLRSLMVPASPTCHEIPVSWKSLTHLKITPSRSHLTRAVALAILRQSTALQSCEFGIAGRGGDEFVPGEHFSLPHLSHLAVVKYGAFLLDHLFGNVTLPNLRSLHYKNTSGSGETNLIPVLPATPSLEWFKIHVSGLRSDSLLDVLSRMPALKILTIWEEPCTTTTDTWFLPRDGHFLEHLTPSHGPGSVCPRLETIELYNFSAVSDETLLQFVRSRTEPQPQNVAHLSRVVARLGRPMEFDLHSRLQDAVAGGLAISLIYAMPPFTYSPLEGTDDFSARGWDGWGESWGDDGW